MVQEIHYKHADCFEKHACICPLSSAALRCSGDAATRMYSDTVSITTGLPPAIARLLLSHPSCANQLLPGIPSLVFEST
jgi:hypothetical protein